MGKSKFSAKVEKKIQTRDPHKKSRHVYYDEKITQKGPSMSKNVFILVIGIIMIGSGTGIYFLLAGNSANNGNGGSTATTLGDVLSEGDVLKAHYKLWIADVSGPWGVIDTSEAPDEDSTIGDPFESTTEDVILGFKINILGMIEGEGKTFTLESGDGYTTGELADFRLTFWVQIVEIL